MLCLGDKELLLQCFYEVVKYVFFSSYFGAEGSKREENTLCFVHYLLFPSGTNRSSLISNLDR